MGIQIHLFLETNLRQQFYGIFTDLLLNFLLIPLIIFPFLSQQLTGQHDVLQSGILGKQVEVLEYQTEVQSLLANFLFLQGGGVGGIENCVAVDQYLSFIGSFQKVQAPQ